MEESRGRARSGTSRPLTIGHSQAVAAAKRSLGYIMQDECLFLKVNTFASSMLLARLPARWSWAQSTCTISCAGDDSLGKEEK